MERADSLAFDLHKWMYVPYEAGCVLVRDPDHHRAAFTSPAEYLAHTDRGIASTDVWLSDYGPQLSRGFRALKIWMSFKEHGLAKYARLIEQNVEQAEYLGRHVEASPDLELLTPVSLKHRLLPLRRARAVGRGARSRERRDPAPDPGERDRGAELDPPRRAVRDPRRDHQPPQPSRGLRSARARVVERGKNLASVVA
mgnify:CR=1 FL=1